MTTHVRSLIVLLALAGCSPEPQPCEPRAIYSARPFRYPNGSAGVSITYDGNAFMDHASVPLDCDTLFIINPPDSAFVRPGEIADTTAWYPIRAPLPVCVREPKVKP